LSAVFPDAAALIKGMVLEERYRVVPFEMLNRPHFLHLIQTAFPRINWEKPATRAWQQWRRRKKAKARVVGSGMVY